MSTATRTLEAEQFAYSMLTRSQRISHENLRLRDRAYVERYENLVAARAFAQAACRADDRAQHPADADPVPRARRHRCRTGSSCRRWRSTPPRTARPATIIWCTSARARMGGAGLVFAEMTCVAPDARITPGCAGLWNERSASVEPHRRLRARRRPTRRSRCSWDTRAPRARRSVGWEASDEPLPDGNWPLVAPSRSNILPASTNQVPRAMTRADMDRVKEEFVARDARARRRRASTGSSCTARTAICCRRFISPLTNRRDDEYGGQLANRCRYPLEVFAAIRAAWPADKPISVRISAHDWAEGGITPDDAVAIARLFKAAGADMIDARPGRSSRDAKPVYGRMYQTPFADRIRNEAGIATIAVGAIFEADHANSIIAAGRADLCAHRPTAPRRSGVDAACGSEDRLPRHRVARAIRRRP